MLETPEKKQFWLEQINQLINVGKSTLEAKNDTDNQNSVTRSMDDLCNKKVSVNSIASNSNVAALISPRPAGPQRTLSSARLKRKTTVVKNILSNFKFRA